MDILLILALIWGYNNQPSDVDPIAPTGTTFNQAAGFECQSNCTPATATTIVSADSMDTSTATTTAAEIIAELEAIAETTTVTMTSTSTGTATSTVSSTTGT